MLLNAQHCRRLQLSIDTKDLPLVAFGCALLAHSLIITH